MTALCVSLFVLSSAASIVGSTHPHYALLRAPWTPWILAACVLLSHWRLERWMRPVAMTVLIALALDALYQVAAGVDLLGHPPVHTRMTGFLPHPNDLALVPILLPFARPAVWPSGALAILLSRSRNAILGLGVVLTAAVPPRRRGLVVALLLVVVLGWWGLHHPDLGDATNAVTGRASHWLVALRMFREAPWLGQGPQTFVDAYMIALSRGDVLAFGIKPEVAFIPWAHSLYLEQLAERGLLGVVAFTVPVILVFRRGSRPVRQAMAALLVMGVVDLTFLKPWVVAAYFGLVMLALAPTAEHV